MEHDTALGIVRIPLSGKKGAGKSVIVDVEDAERLGLTEMSWNLGTKYAVRNTMTRPRTALLMHRFIMDAPKGICVDHINGDTLDNRRCNLRLATYSENQMNRKVASISLSGLKGVSTAVKRNGAVSYIATIQINGKRYSLGSHKTAQAAHLAYQEGAKRLFGEFAHF